MYCSNCGKTIGPEDKQCPGCGLPVGDNGFTDKTSVQFIIKPGRSESSAFKGSSSTYIRTTNTNSIQPEDGIEHWEGHTTYRPAFNDGIDIAPRETQQELHETLKKGKPIRTYEDIPDDDDEQLDPEEQERRDVRRMLYEDPDVKKKKDSTPKTTADEEDADEPVDESVVEEERRIARRARELPYPDAAIESIRDIERALQPDEDVDLSQLRVHDIYTTSRQGLSKDVSDYMRSMDQSSKRPGKPGPKRRTYDDIPPEEPAEDEEPQEEDNVDEEATPVKNRILSRKKRSEDYDDYIDEEENPDNPDDRNDPDSYDDGDDAYERPAIDWRKLVLPVVICVVIFAAVFGIVRWVSFIKNRSVDTKIEGVSTTLYESGISVLKSHTEKDYVNRLVSVYTKDGILSVSNEFAAAQNELKVLLPSEPAVNDAEFLNALIAVETNIETAITADAMNQDTASNSEARWNRIKSTIAQMEAASTILEINAISSSEIISLSGTTPQPTATPEPTARPLQKGDSGSDVLALQQRLTTLGYLNDKVDGQYGSKTQSAIKLFQQVAGLTVNGIADTATLELLKSDNAPYAPGAATPTPPIGNPA